VLEKVGLFPVLWLASSLAGAQTPDSNWVGTWTLNVAYSILIPPPLKSETIVIPPPGWSAQAVKYTGIGTGANGSVFDLSFDGAADGKPYPLMSSGKEIATAVWHRVSSHHYSAMFTFPSVYVNLAVYMAADGRRYTFQEHITPFTGRHIMAPTGHNGETLVFDKR
jgi:hypothetical protein